MPGALTPSYLNWNYTMPSLGPNGELTGGPDPYADQADMSKGVDIRNPDGTFTHMDAHKDRNGNYINPTTFMSDSLPGGVAYAYPDTDEYSHLGRVFRTDRNRSIGKMLAIIGGGALAAGAGGAGAGAGQGALSTGEGISPGFLSAETAAGLEGAGAAIPLGADVMTVTAPALGGITAAQAAGIAGAGAGALSSGFTPAGASQASGEFDPNAGFQGSTGGGEGLPALPGDVGMEGANATNPGFFSKLGTMGKNYIHNPDGSLNMGNTLSLISSGLGALGSIAGNGQQASAQLPAGWNDPLPKLSFNRQRTAPMTDYANYGKAGKGNEAEHRFFTDASFSPAGTAPQVALPQETPQGPNMHLQNPGDLTMEPVARAAQGGMPAVKGPGSGRDDKIEALLSDGEYVFDAETVAMLGDGSVDEGAARLDKLRENVRRHKGAALAQGKISPNAKPPEQYLNKAKGGAIKPRFTADELKEQVRRLAEQYQRTRPTPVAPEDAQEQLRQIARRYLNTPPDQRAKGGRIRGDWVKGVIQGGLPDEARLARLQEALRVESILKQSDFETPPSGGEPSSAILEAQQRVAAIREMMKNNPVKKAKGGAVKQLDILADTLEDALQLGEDPKVADVILPGADLVPAKVI